MFTPTKDIKSLSISIFKDNYSFPQIKLLNSCKDLSSFIKGHFLNKNKSSKIQNEILIFDKKETFKVNEEKIYNEILNDKLLIDELNTLFKSLNIIITHLETYNKKIVEQEKIRILFDLNTQLNEYLNNLPKEKEKKINYLISSKAEMNEQIINDQIHKFFSLNEKNEKNEEDSKDTILMNKENNFDNLSEIGEKESFKESVYDEEKEIIESMKIAENKKKFKKLNKLESQFKINDYFSFLNNKIKRNKEPIDINEK